MRRGHEDTLNFIPSPGSCEDRGEGKQSPFHLGAWGRGSSFNQGGQRVVVSMRHPGLNWAGGAVAWDARPDLGARIVPLPVQGPVTTVISAQAPGDRAV